jgi:aminopeptidase N
VELLRFYSALMLVDDDSLAAQATQIALSPEIPPQSDSRRVHFITLLARQHQELAWRVFCDHFKTLLAPHSPYDSYIIAQYVPQIFWKDIPLDQLEAWIRGHVPPEMADTVERGMQTARFKLTEKRMLVSAADAYLQGR